MNRKSASLFIFALALAVTTFYGGFYYGKSQVPSIYAIEGVGNKSLTQPDDVDFSLFWDAWKIIQDKYVDRSSLDRKKMVYGAIDGMVKSLKDPYTTFFEPVRSKTV